MSKKSTHKQSSLFNPSVRLRFPAAAILACFLCFCLAGCGNSSDKPAESSASASGQSELISTEFFSMDTYMTLSVYGDGAEEALEQAAAMIVELEEEVSTEKPDSTVARLNRQKSADLSGSSLALISEALALYRETDGAFNIAIYPLMKAWGFPSQEYRVPTDQEIDTLLAATDLSSAALDETGHITLPAPEMEIDLGGITKGWASAQAVQIFQEYGLPGGLINLGGNVQVFGTKPDGSLWRVAVQSPYEKDDYLGVLELTDKAVITSGGYERFFEQDGKVYHHIMDPATGRPAESGLLSVTIVSSDGMLADGLSTALFVMGKDDAIAFWRTKKEDFDFILMDEQNVLYVSEGIADCFSSDLYPVEVVRR